MLFFFFFFNDTATTEIYTLSLHDALPISPPWSDQLPPLTACAPAGWAALMSVQFQGAGQITEGIGSTVLIVTESSADWAVAPLYESAASPASRKPGICRITVEPATGVQLSPSGEVKVV